MSLLLDRLEKAAKLLDRTRARSRNVFHTRPNDEEDLRQLIEDAAKKIKEQEK